MSYNSPKSGTVVWSNKTNASSTTNTTLTSAVTFVPFLYGGMTEAVFDTIAAGSAVSANFTGTTALVQNSFNGILGCQNANGNDGNTVTFQSPGNIDVGVYKVEYGIVFGDIAAIVDMSYKANGAGGFSALRTGVDCYVSGGDPFPVSFIDFITVTTGGNPFSIRWTANGKNAGSASFWVRPCGSVRLTKLG